MHDCPVRGDGRVPRSAGPWDKAIALQQDAISAASQAHDQPGQARNLLLLAGMQVFIGDSLTGAATCARALEIYRELGDLGGQADTFSGLASLHTTTGDYQLAADYAERALALFSESGQNRAQADVLCARHAARSRRRLSRCLRLQPAGTAALG